NVAWLEAAFSAVIQRHDMLRTTFAMEDGELFQRVAASSTFQLQQTNLEAIPADTRKASAERCLAEETCRPFDLAAGPPFRAVLIRLQPTEHVLMLVLHHIISDGWSRSNFYRELSTAYEALGTGSPAAVRELPILLAAFKTLLYRYTGHDDLIVGVPIANRQRVEVEGLIDFFANTLVMRTTFPTDLTFRELLRRVKQTAVEAYANQDMPFERLVELLHVRRDASRTPLFQVSFAIQDYPAVNFRLPGIQTSPWFVTTRTSKFDFSLTMERSAEGWTAA